MENTQFQQLVLQQLEVLIKGQTRLEDRQTNLEQAFVRLEERQTKLEQGFTRLEDRQTNLEQGFARLENRQTKLEQGFARLEERQTNLEQAFVRLEERQTKLEQGFVRLEENQENLAKKLDIIYEQTGMLTEFRTEVNKKLDSLQRKQDRQEKILERLSLRSIEQEADIAHLRMAK